MEEILDLFILDSESHLILPESFSWEEFDKYNILGDITFVKNNQEINLAEKRLPYYFVLYDNECIEEQMAAALRAFCEADLDFVKFYKREKNGKYSVVPRLFKSDVFLPLFGTLPINWENLKSEVCLNGFLFTF